VPKSTSESRTHYCRPESPHGVLQFVHKLLKQHGALFSVQSADFREYDNFSSHARNFYLGQKSFISKVIVQIHLQIQNRLKVQLRAHISYFQGYTH